MRRPRETLHPLVEKKLPRELQQLGYAYPNAAFNAATDWDQPPLTQTPQDIEIYYGDESLEPDRIVVGDRIKGFSWEEPSADDLNVIQVCSDDGRGGYGWIYIEVEGQVLLDRIQDTPLPKAIADPEATVRAAIQQLEQSQN